MKINKISPSTNLFTSILADLPDTPKNLYIRGNIPQKRIKSVAIVGARKPTTYGKEIAGRLAREFAQNGIVVISGMALGIDGIAHRAALEAGGITIAVLANGVDKFYPSSHSTLGQKIIDNGGAIISEYEPGTPALPYRFLERNRIVSGLADAVIIVEAAARSGTLSTATHALNQGKDVFAVPGNITSPLSEGCNKLIKMGAEPLLSAQEVIEKLIPRNSKDSHQTTIFKGDSPEEQLIIDLLLKGIQNGDELATQAKMSVMTFNQTITMLEIKDIVASLGANQWTLK